MMAKIIMCDICGRVPGPYEHELKRYKSTKWIPFREDIKQNPKEVDICSKCLKLIRKLRECEDSKELKEIADEDTD